jgi:hypothetical protein
MIDFRKFYNAKFYDSSMNPIPITEANIELATVAGFMPEYDFSQVPDLPLPELVEMLLKELPTNFTFIRTTPTIVNTALASICKRIRPDIKFIDPFGDVDKDWYTWALPTLLPNNPQSVHELYTAWKLSKDGIPCGLVGPTVGFVDLGVITKNTVTFSATESNWQIVDLYKTISTRLLAEHCPELIHPNFTLLLARAYLKLLDFEKNWVAYRVATLNRCVAGHFALALNPIADHDIKSISNQTDYPKYPGLVTRSTHDVCFSYKAFL